ncbi:hypothetical protein BH10PAT3_BH10PAT3_5600 [soil metagenome]
MKKHSGKKIAKNKLKYILPAGLIVLSLLVVALVVFKNHQSRQLVIKTESLSGTNSQSSLSVVSNPNQDTISVGQNNQQTLIYGQMSADNLFENINLRRNYKGLGTLTSDQNLSRAASDIIDNHTLGTDNNAFTQLIKNSGYKYNYVATSILASCSDLSCALQSLEYANTDKGIYNAIYKDVGVAVSGDQKYAVILWGQPYQKPASSYSGGSSSGSSSSGSTYILPDLSYKYTPPPDIDYSRPSPTLNTGGSTPTNSCTPVTSTEPSKYYYKCGYGQRATGVNCKAIAPYDYTSNLWSCNK